MILWIHLLQTMVNAVNCMTFKKDSENWHFVLLYSIVFAGPYWTHVKEYWEIRDRSNVLYIKYEDMKKVKTRQPMSNLT